MKTHYLQKKRPGIYLMTIGMAIFSTALFAQGQWSQKSNMDGDERKNAVGFSMDGKGYIGLGMDSQGNERKDVWQYDPGTDTWIQKADKPGSGLAGASVFVIGDSAYIVCGKFNGNDVKQFFAYQATDNTWVQKAEFPGLARHHGIGLSINGKGYVGLGDRKNGDKLKDYWEYDQSTGNWTQKADFAGGNRACAAGFSLDGMGYVGTGSSDTSGITGDFWQYDPIINLWLQKSDFGGSPRFGAVGFSMEQGNKGYIGTGSDSDDLWEYDPTTDSWIEKEIYTGGSRTFAIGICLNGKGYIGTGQDEFGAVSNDFWEYNADATENDPIADFFANDTCLGEPVQFIDSSSTSGNTEIIAWNWDFGDGNSSVVKNPIHIYNSSGEFTVKLVVTDDQQNQDSTEKTLIIFDNPEADFSYFANALNDMQVQFTNESSGEISVSWDFGDGNTSTGENPIHTYSTDGNYTVCITAVNNEGCEDEFCERIVVGNPNTEADFIAKDTCQGDPVEFMDQSSGNISEWRWDFGDGNTSTDQNPMHIYSEAGLYTVKLIITDQKNEQDSMERSVSIFNKPIVNFEHTLTPGLTVDFTGNTSEGEAFFWWFGDGNSSMVRNPTHTYAVQGNYQVCFSAYNMHGCEGKSCSNITVSPVSVSVFELEQEVVWEIYPNPATESVYIKGNLTKGTLLEIMDITGRVLYSEVISHNHPANKWINLQDYSKGAYFVSIQNKEKRMVKKLMVK